MSETLVKRCPLLDKWCIKDSCEFYIPLLQQKITLGVKQTNQTNMCCFVALAMIMSNQKIEQKVVNMGNLRGHNG